MLKKILAIFLSLTFLASTVMIHSVLQKPDSVSASSAPVFYTWNSLSNKYILAPYSWIHLSDAVPDKQVLVGGMYHCLYNVTADAYFLHITDGTYIGSSNGYGYHEDSGVHVSRGTGTQSDPYVVYGL